MTLARMIPLETLRNATVEILRGANVPVRDASTVADSIAAAEARGQSSHGVMRLDTYVKRVQAGLIAVGVTPRPIRETASTVLLDAGAAFGHVAGVHAMDLCIEKAAQTGVGAAAVRNSSHFGIASFFAMRAATHGYIGIATSNGAARMPPVGTRTAVLGTNPVAVAVPRTNLAPIVLDMATSVAALGRILAARDARELIPEGWALALDGRATTDAAVAAEGLLLPFAGPKGFGLALVLEILCAVLSGASAGRRAGSMYRTWDRPEDLGHFFMALAIDAFTTHDAFDAALHDVADQVHGADPLEAGGTAYLPGELEDRHERRARTEGIRLTPALSSALVRAATSAGVTLDPELDVSSV
jgi:LDH2 family malate/lactate/ureidoglycolate dehydrogenase